MTDGTLAEVYARIQSVMDALTPDHQASTGDRFRYTDNLESRDSTDRSYTIELVDAPVPAKVTTRGTDRHSVGLSVAVRYAKTPQLKRRLREDLDRITVALRTVANGTSAARVANFEGSGIDESESSDKCIDVFWFLRVEYGPPSWT